MYEDLMPIDEIQDGCSDNCVGPSGYITRVGGEYWYTAPAVGIHERYTLPPLKRNSWAYMVYRTPRKGN